jgi:hypothetical protein
LEWRGRACRKLPGLRPFPIEPRRGDGPSRGHGRRGDPDAHRPIAGGFLAGATALVFTLATRMDSAAKPRPEVTVYKSPT